MKVIPLTREAYRAYGDIIAAFDDVPYRPANMNTAKRFNHLCDLQNLRSADAKLNVCVFRCSAWMEPVLELKLLEKHQYSSQAFIPMDREARYLAVVCLGEETPDLSTLCAFVVEGPYGVSYRPGVWHYPMTALNRSIDFSCLVFENESKDDCQIFALTPPVLIEL